VKQFLLDRNQAQLQQLSSEREDIVASAAPSIARAGELTAAVALAQTQVPPSPRCVFRCSG